MAHQQFHQDVEQPGKRLACHTGSLSRLGRTKPHRRRMLAAMDRLGCCCLGLLVGSSVDRQHHFNESALLRMTGNLAFSLKVS